MTRVYWTAAVAALLATLFVTCGASGTVSEGDRRSDQPGVTARDATPAVGSAGPQEPPAKKEGDDGFDPNAFPPVVSDVDYHKGAWMKDDCLRCHETGVGDATRVEHKGMPPILLTAKCRSCHVLIRGMPPIEKKPTGDGDYADNAFPPMIPASASHRDAWTNDSCLLCHEGGVKGAPIVKHKDLPKVLLKAKCRSCHVQVRRPVVPGR